MTRFLIYEPPPTGLRLLVTRIGFVAGIIGWVAVLLALLGAPIAALIYHVIH